MRPDELIMDGLDRVAGAITPQGAMAGRDASGGRVSSLTEAVMGITSGLVRVAEAIEGLSGAIRGIGKEACGKMASQNTPLREGGRASHCP